MLIYIIVPACVRSRNMGHGHKPGQPDCWVTLIFCWKTRLALFDLQPRIPISPVFIRCTQPTILEVHFQAESEKDSPTVPPCVRSRPFGLLLFTAPKPCK